MIKEQQSNCVCCQIAIECGCNPNRRSNRKHITGPAATPSSLRVTTSASLQNGKRYDGTITKVVCFIQTETLVGNRHYDFLTALPGQKCCRWKFYTPLPRQQMIKKRDLFLLQVASQCGWNTKRCSNRKHARSLQQTAQFTQGDQHQASTANAADTRRNNYQSGVFNGNTLWETDTIDSLQVCLDKCSALEVLYTHCPKGAKTDE